VFRDGANEGQCADRTNCWREEKRLGWSKQTSSERPLGEGEYADAGCKTQKRELGDIQAFKDPKELFKVQVRGGSRD
jgi:hypothetical protein